MVSHWYTPHWVYLTPLQYRLTLANDATAKQIYSNNKTHTNTDEKIWMSFRVKVKFALEAAMGMFYLHQSNPPILHRDLKSDNLLVTQDWSIKVAGMESICMLYSDWL